MNEDHYNQLIDSEKERNNFNSWNSWRQSNPDLEIDLEEAKLFALNLTGANLSNTNLTEAVFYKSKINSVNFSGSDLTHTEFYELNIKNSNFLNANLRGSNFSKAKVLNCNTDGSLFVRDFDVLCRSKICQVKSNFSSGR